MRMRGDGLGKELAGSLEGAEADSVGHLLLGWGAQICKIEHFGQYWLVCALPITASVKMLVNDCLPVTTVEACVGARCVKGEPTDGLPGS